MNADVRRLSVTGRQFCALLQLSLLAFWLHNSKLAQFCMQELADTPRPHMPEHRDLPTLTEIENIKHDDLEFKSRDREAGWDAEGSKADHRNPQDGLEAKEGGVDSGKAECTAEQPGSGDAADEQEGVGLNCSCYHVDEVCVSTSPAVMGITCAKQASLKL